MAAFGMAEPAVTMSEAQAYVRIETGEEEAILAGLIRTASALCESFINQVVIAREFVEELPASGAWERLASAPTRAITSVEGVDEEGLPVALQTSDYSIDVDSSGDGWVCIFRGGGWELGLVRGSSVVLGGQQVVGTRLGAIAAPAGGTTVDGEARAAIAQILAALRQHGLIAT